MCSTRHTTGSWKLFGLAPPLAGKEVIDHIHPVNQPAFRRLIEALQVKAYSLNTITTYHNEFAQLLYLLKAHPVDDLNAERLRSYFLYCINTLHVSKNTLHSQLNAIKFYRSGDPVRASTAPGEIIL